MNRILIVEDEKNLARFIELELQHENYETAVANDGRAGLELALNEEWDAILLDLMLPHLNGVEVCRRVRQVKQTPIIMITARDSVIDRVSGLDHGADDYIVKPFAIEELLARLRSLLRRVENAEQSAKQTTLQYRNEKPVHHPIIGSERIYHLRVTNHGRIVVRYNGHLRRHHLLSVNRWFIHNKLVRTTNKILRKINASNILTS